MKRQHVLLLTGMLLVSWAHGEKRAAAEEAFTIDGKAVQLAKYAKAFIGNGNITVEIAPYKMGDQEGAILLFQGVEGEWDGKAINHGVEANSGDGLDYTTTHAGKPWHTLVIRKPADGATYDLYIPGIKEVTRLSPSDGAAQQTNPRKIFHEYQRQQSRKK